MSLYAIGDVQGCFSALERLLAQVAFDPAHDELLFVGDLVNRGPQSLQVLRFVRDLGSRAQMVLGNHDLHLLTVAEGFSRLRDDDTLGPILAAPDRTELLDWLRAQPLALMREGWLTVHAGLLPQWSVPQALALADEVQTALRAEDYRVFLAKLYGSRPTRWDDRLQGFDRLRVIVNAMTRMRFCSASGEMEFATKGESRSAPHGFMPWFDVPGRNSATTPIVCGHWSALGHHRGATLAAIDTGCVWGGALTALRLADRAVFQVSCE